LKQDLQNQQKLLKRNVEDVFIKISEQIKNTKRLLNLFDPTAALRRGYALVKLNEKFVKSIKQLKLNDQLSVKLADGTIGTTVEKINPNEQ
jgi:exodeoxyribonuclease VII large subunit